MYKFLHVQILHVQTGICELLMHVSLSRFTEFQSSAEAVDLYAHELKSPKLGIPVQPQIQYAHELF